MLGWGFGTLVFGSVSPSLPTAGLPGQPSDEANGVGGNAQPGLAGCLQTSALSWPQAPREDALLATRLDLTPWRRDSSSTSSPFLPSPQGI